MTTTSDDTIDHAPPTTRLGHELRDWADAHIELARVEAGEAGRAVGGLGARWAMAHAAIVVGLALAAVGMTGWLAERLGASSHLVGILVGLALVVAASLFGWLSYRRFRSEFTAFEQTAEELREDIVWLREQIGPRDGAVNDSAGNRATEA